ncbi:MAG: hypothetical protein AAGJ35_04915, partial [Myxococcota bacterium]
VDPTDEDLLNQVRQVAKMTVQPFVAGITALRQAIRIYFYGESTAEVLRVVKDAFPDPQQAALLSNTASARSGHSPTPGPPSAYSEIARAWGDNYAPPAFGGGNHPFNQVDAQFASSSAHIQQELENLRSYVHTELNQLREYVRKRAQEQKALIRGLLDLMVSRGQLQRDDLVKLLETVSKAQNG